MPGVGSLIAFVVLMVTAECSLRIPALKSKDFVVPHRIRHNLGKHTAKNSIEGKNTGGNIKGTPTITFCNTTSTPLVVDEYVSVYLFDLFFV